MRGIAISDASAMGRASLSRHVGHTSASAGHGRGLPAARMAPLDAAAIRRERAAAGRAASPKAMPIRSWSYAAAGDVGVSDNGSPFIMTESSHIQRVGLCKTPYNEGDNISRPFPLFTSLIPCASPNKTYRWAKRSAMR